MLLYKPLYICVCTCVCACVCVCMCTSQRLEAGDLIFKLQMLSSELPSGEKNKYNSVKEKIANKYAAIESQLVDAFIDAQRSLDTKCMRQYALALQPFPRVRIHRAHASKLRRERRHLIISSFLSSPSVHSWPDPTLLREDELRMVMVVMTMEWRVETNSELSF